MTDSTWFLGIDLGTGSCKSVVIDDKADILGFGVGEYAASDSHNRWQEQNPRELLQAAITSVQRATADAGVDSDQCAGLSIGGALHSIMALDRNGKPLTGVFTWADGRAVDQAEAIRQQPLAKRLYEQTGCPSHGMYPLYKIMWLRENEPEVFRKAWRYLTAKEYVFARLTGEYLVDYCLAAGSGLLNTHSLTWESLCLDAAGIRENQLSPPVSPLTVHHGLDPDIAGQMGIRRDVPVVLGSSDAANSNIGAGAVLPWQATCMIGTSGAFRVLCPQPILDRQARSWCYAVDEGHWLVGGAINNCHRCSENREMIVPSWGETSGLGAAFWAMLGTGSVAGLERLTDFVQPERSCRPRKEKADLYQKIYPLFNFVPLNHGIVHLKPWRAGMKPARPFS